MNLQSEFLRLYLQSGYNLVLWNYRGYGRTARGYKPLTMRMMQEDGLAVVKHVKQNMVTGKVGVHGVSLGGSVASYIAANVKVDFLFCDRSF